MMWKDLLGETVRAFLARWIFPPRPIFFPFFEKKKKVYSFSQLQIWLEAHLENITSVVVKDFPNSCPKLNESGQSRGEAAAVGFQE